MESVLQMREKTPNIWGKDAQIWGKDAQHVPGTRLLK
jgi:hypothetical protein